jgi:hypothetical protein
VNGGTWNGAERLAEVEGAQRRAARIHPAVGIAHHAVLALPSSDKIDGKRAGVAVYLEWLTSGRQMLVQQLLH